jgi:hypothetical protein
MVHSKMGEEMGKEAGKTDSRQARRYVEGEEVGSH